MSEPTPQVVIVRHPRERVAKCSLEPLNGRPGIEFHRATPQFRYDATGHLLLAVDAPLISRDDAWLDDVETDDLEREGRAPVRDAAGRPLRPVLLLDSTWRLLPSLQAKITGTPLRRSLPPSLRTAYPRVSKLGFDPEGGLASIEALYAALRLLGFDRPDLLDAYHWRDAFLAGWNV